MNALVPQTPARVESDHADQSGFSGVLLRALEEQAHPTGAGHADGIHDDAKALADWLGFVGMRNLETCRSYRKEVMRFRMFLETVHAANPGRQQRFLLRDATEMDVLLYEAHLCGKLRTGEPVSPLMVPAKILSRYGKRVQDQPFVTWLPSAPDTPAALCQASPIQLKASSVNQALSILHALYERWLQPDPQTKSAYVGANPVKRIKGASNRMQRQTGRNFPAEAMQAMLAAAQLQTIEARANAKLSADAQKDLITAVARQRWIAAMLFGLWGRRAEIASILMSDFTLNGVRWTVSMKRKGGKTQVLPVAPWVMNELMQYRQAIGLSALPTPTETFPCIQRLAKPKNARFEKSLPVHPDLIYRDVESLCSQASSFLRSAAIMPTMPDIDRHTLASQLDSISPHWFRHSGASIAINSGAMSLENASKMLGHSSPIVTAEMYYHPSESQIAEGMEKLGQMALS